MLGTTPSIHIERYTNYLSYKYNLLKNTNVWNTAEKIYSYSRRSFFIAKIFRYSSAVIAFVETSAVFLVCGAALLLLIPLTLLLTLVFVIIDAQNGKRLNKLIVPKLKGKRIIFLIAKNGFSIKRGAYFDNMAIDLAKNQDNFVIVVSRSLKSGGLYGLTLSSENLAVIRETNFFRLNKSIKASGIDTNNAVIVH